MNPRMIKLAAASSAAAALALGGGAWALAGSGDDSGAVTGPGADQARAAALEYLGGGTANAVELDNEQGATWEVEVTKTSGETVDVRLDANFEVVGEDSDTEGENEQGENEQGENEDGPQDDD